MSEKEYTRVVIFKTRGNRIGVIGVTATGSMLLEDVATFDDLDAALDDARALADSIVIQSDAAQTG